MISEFLMLTCDDCGKNMRHGVPVITHLELGVPGTVFTSHSKMLNTASELLWVIEDNRHRCPLCAGIWPNLTPIESKIGEISEVLYEWDGPRIYVAKTSTPLSLFYFVEKDRGISRYLVAHSLDAEVVELLKSCKMSIRQVFETHPLTVVDFNSSHEILQTYLVSIGDVPDDALPEDDVFLRPKGDLDEWDHGREP